MRERKFVLRKRQLSISGQKWRIRCRRSGPGTVCERASINVLGRRIRTRERLSKSYWCELSNKKLCKRMHTHYLDWTNFSRIMDTASTIMDTASTMNYYLAIWKYFFTTKIKICQLYWYCVLLTVFMTV